MIVFLGEKASIALLSAFACSGSSVLTSRIWSVVFGWNMWCTTTTFALCITLT